MGKPEPDDSGVFRLRQGSGGQARLETPASRLGLYIHIPFCSSICNYCNFNRGLYDEALKTRYVAALRQEIASAPAGLSADPASAKATAGPPKRSAKADTIFFGGGTPSLLEPAEIADIIRSCRDRFATR